MLAKKALELHQKGNYAEAEKVYRELLASYPNDARTLSLFGVMLFQIGRAEEGLPLARRAAQLNQGFLTNLANILQSTGKLSEAQQAYEQAMNYSPNDPVLLSNYSDLCREIGKFEHGVLLAQRAVQIDPKAASAWAHLGNSLKGLGRLEEAEAAHRHAINLQPNHPVFNNNLSAVLLNLARSSEAFTHAHIATFADPKDAVAQINFSTAAKNVGALHIALEAARKAVELQPGNFGIVSNYLVLLNYHPALSADLIACEHRLWGKHLVSSLGTSQTIFDNNRSADRKLRIGYVSPDFREHPVARAVLPLLENHDHSQFEVFGYNDSETSDEMTAHIRTLCDHWVDFKAIDHADFAQRVRDDKIDILVDLALHTAGNRMIDFARKPAPVQVSYAGYPATTGLPTIDYRITDNHLDPIGETENLNTEKLIRLKNSFWCYTPDDSVSVNDLPATTKNYITFGSLNNPSKHGPASLELFARVLDAVPNSQLAILVYDPGDDPGRFIDQLIKNRISPQRVRAFSRRDRADYLKLYHDIDIALDPLPYNGHMTSCDALWMGVPVVSLRGKTSVGRGGASLLNCLGMTDLLAQTEDEYVEITVELAKDRQRLREMRKTLRPRMRTSPLCDGKSLAREIEKHYRWMWHQYVGS